MMRHLVLLTLVTLGPSGLACTTFSLPNSDGKIVGKSFDWHQEHGLAFANRRNQEKIAFTIDPRLTPARWTSKYGSVTLNQYAREAPIGGMNEAGLVVENMWLEESVYPAIGSTPTLNELQFIQYQLDNYGTLTELLQNLDRIRVARVYGILHYLACDTTGDCATIEYINGDLIANRLCTTCGNPVFVLTNDTYEKSLAFLKNLVGFGGTAPVPAGPESLHRFARAATRVKDYVPSPTQSPVAYAFETLDAVDQSEGVNKSIWNNVYDRSSMKIHFRTRSLKAIKDIDVMAFDYSCTKPTPMLEMADANGGNTNARFVPYSATANKRLIDQSFQHFAHLLPPGALDRLAAYPETLRCTE